jgi:hypothetical protein
MKPYRRYHNRSLPPLSKINEACSIEMFLFSTGNEENMLKHGIDNTPTISIFEEHVPICRSTRS